MDKLDWTLGRRIIGRCAKLHTPLSSTRYKTSSAGTWDSRRQESMPTPKPFSDRTAESAVQTPDDLSLHEAEITKQDKSSVLVADIFQGWQKSTPWVVGTWTMCLRHADRFTASRIERCKWWDSRRPEVKQMTVELSSYVWSVS
jgi:hypothetical protein